MQLPAAETIQNINQVSVQGAIIECTTQHWSPKFHNGDENFEDRHLSANYNNQLKAVVIEDPCKMA